ncbi:hypothetical protein BC939DRAFT_498203 [Gamsiella multidivaricata]|uniref:uncharacterized protein n=1 Tax=Gamsiella multidivaricata TaxID=101098 RepID=UPI0022207462|nr:uncharacterized protein BC939DRAFT_498203 [Gamsiella multidivaricata]KAI7832808.1 hypothetical protein BC939DRAFT_498203 [Gamsiella multidivaricata]
MSQTDIVVEQQVEMGSTGQADTTESDHVLADAWGQINSTAGQQTAEDSSSRNMAASRKRCPSGYTGLLAGEPKAHQRKDGFPSTLHRKGGCPSQGIITHSYFRTRKVAEWNLDGFLTSIGLTEVAFTSILKDMSRIKRLPSGIQIFAKRLEDYYGGVFQEVIEMAKNNVRKNVTARVQNEKEHLLL